MFDNSSLLSSIASGIFNGPLVYVALVSGSIFLIASLLFGFKKVLGVIDGTYDPGSFDKLKFADDVYGDDDGKYDFYFNHSNSSMTREEVDAAWEHEISKKSSVDTSESDVQISFGSTSFGSTSFGDNRLDSQEFANLVLHYANESRDRSSIYDDEEDQYDYDDSYDKGYV